MDIIAACSWGEVDGDEGDSDSDLSWIMLISYGVHPAISSASLAQSGGFSVRSDRISRIRTLESGRAKNRAGRRRLCGESAVREQRHRLGQEQIVMS